MDYSVRDSSVVQDPHAFRVFDESDCAIRTGIVREERELRDGTVRYMVEVASGGRQIPISCVLLTRWGGAYNFEEYRIRPWVKNFPANLLAPASASRYDLRSGDVVLVAFLDGQSREGVILGGLRHPSRKEKTTKGNIEYISQFNGLETQIRADGSYKVIFKGAAVTEKSLELPPTGTPLVSPQFNPLVAGSFFGFDKDGSYVLSDGDAQYLKIKKDIVNRVLVIVSGGNRIDLSGNLIKGKMGFQTDTWIVDTKQLSMKSSIDYKVETLLMSLKATQMAIGSDQFELFDGLVKLIDALGSLVVTSPVGTCTPLMAAPTWAAQVIPLKVKISTMVSSLKSADAFEASDEGEKELSGDIGG